MSSYCFMQAQVRKVYKALKEEEDEDFAWDTGTFGTVSILANYFVEVNTLHAEIIYLTSRCIN